jgi:nicotinic acid mononucleotide adenylyltransferase
VAHLALAAAASSHVDEILCVVPRAFPHKEYFGATLEQRIEMLGSLQLTIPHSVATTEQGLFIDIARECRAQFGAETGLSFLCGRDAAERILTWDYGRAGVVEEMLKEFELLVAARDGDFEAPSEFRRRIHSLRIPPRHYRVSSTEVRDRIARGAAWEHLLPEPIMARMRQIYS